MKLTQEHIDSALWTLLREHYTAELATLRARNDHFQPEYSTAELRGRIQQIKNFLALETPAPVILPATEGP